MDAIITHLALDCRLLSMKASVTKIDATTANVIAGFSERFNSLLDRASVPRENRITYCAHRFDVVHNTVISWLEKNKIPGKHALLVRIVTHLLKDIPGRYDAHAVVAWLLTGDSVPNPFHDDTDALQAVELYFQISDLARAHGIDFDGMPREVRNLILRRVQGWLRHQAAQTKGPLTLDDSARTIVLGMIEAAQASPKG